MRDRKLFVAGATGATGSVLMALAAKHSIRAVPHVRPKSAAGRLFSVAPAVFELSDSAALSRTLSDCTTVLQLIGTMRKRFSSGDTYETSDIGTTRALVEAAKTAKVEHFILLSSVGAGRPFGAYLKAKAEAERIVVESGLPYTIVRPSALQGGPRGSVPGVRAITQALRMNRYIPIRLEELAGALLQMGVAGGPLNTVLEGTSLWTWVRAWMTSVPATAAVPSAERAP